MMLGWLKKVFTRDKMRDKMREESKEIDIQRIRKMCKKSIESGVCPKICDRCAWNTDIYKEV